MNELALFAGAGGGILGGHLLEWRTVCAVEWEPYPTSVLIARQNEGVLPPFPIWDDVRTFDGRPWRGRVDVVSGGFPCQDISAAGKGAGINGERSGMWAHMARIIREVGPRYAFVENSPMLTSRGLGRVLGDLAAMGYDARWGVLGAVDAGAPHKRDRIWIVADDPRSGRGTRRKGRPDPSDTRKPEQSLQELADTQSQRARGLPIGTSSEYTRLGFVGEDVADAGHLRGRHGAESNETQPASLARCGEVCDTAGEGLSLGINGAVGRPRPLSESERSSWWATEPDVGRVAHGMAARVDRLKAIGNGQVPAVAALAWRILSK